VGYTTLEPLVEVKVSLQLSYGVHIAMQLGEFQMCSYSNALPPKTKTAAPTQ
jgi:hypothetical protein